MIYLNTYAEAGTMVMKCGKGAKISTPKISYTLAR
jgi:hypothetical protein